MARVVTFAPQQSEGASVTTRATKKQWANESYVIIIITNIQGQIIMKYTIKCHHEVEFDFSFRTPFL